MPQVSNSNRSEQIITVHCQTVKSKHIVQGDGTCDSRLHCLGTNIVTWTRSICMSILICQAYLRNMYLLIVLLFESRIRLTTADYSIFDAMPMHLNMFFFGFCSSIIVDKAHLSGIRGGKIYFSPLSLSTRKRP